MQSIIGVEGWVTKIVITASPFGKYDCSWRRTWRRTKIYLKSWRNNIKDEKILKIAKEAAGIIAGAALLGSSVLKELRVVSHCGVVLDNVDAKALD